jgi:hypothetical protein
VKQRQLVGVVAGVAVVVAGSTVVALNWPGGSSPPARIVDPGVAAQPVAAQPVAAEAPVVDNGDSGGEPAATSLHSVDVPATGRRSVDVAKRATKPFSLLGLTWSDPGLAVAGTVQVRTRVAKSGAWTPWQTLETQGMRGPDVGAESKRTRRGGSEPLWVGPSDGVAARIVGAGGTKPLPAGLRLDLIDPGKPATGAGKGKSGGQGGGFLGAPVDPSATPVESPSASVAPSVPGPPPVDRVPLPSYTSRKGWEADETIVKAPPGIAPAVKVLFVHHTADGATSPDCTKSKAHVRAIQTYQVVGQGWDDIGYNFLVDSCGTLFEGRAGGVDKAVIGAHTYGFNTGSASIAVLGTYTAGGVPTAARKTIAQVAAARLTAYGFDPASTGELTEGAPDGKFPLGTVVSFSRISGHRDGDASDCPGNALYAQLPALRVEASAQILALKVNAPAGGVSSGGKYYVKGKATLSWTTATPSSAVAKFEVLVDGKPGAPLAGTVRTGSVTVPSGTHTLQLRATHVSGNAETSAAATVVSDVTLPVVSAPWISLRTGTVSTSAVPVTVNFKATDNVKVASVSGTAPSAATLAPTATTWSASSKVGTAVTFTVSAKDLVGNAGKASVVRTTVLQQETSAKRTGTWTTKKVSSHLTGKALVSSKKNTKLTFTFTGRAASLIVGRSTKAGKADVYLDGKKVSTIDTKAGKTLYRQAVWSRNVTAGKHTVAVVVLATSGRPGVTVDGLSTIK